MMTIEHGAHGNGSMWTIIGPVYNPAQMRLRNAKRDKRIELSSFGPGESWTRIGMSPPQSSSKVPLPWHGTDRDYMQSVEKDFRVTILNKW